MMECNMYLLDTNESSLNGYTDDEEINGQTGMGVYEIWAWRDW